MFFHHHHNERALAYKYGIAAGLLEALYCFLVIYGMSQMERFASDREDTLLAPLFFLIIFVFSATISGLIVLGYPTYLILNKKYALALTTVLSSLGIFVVIGALVLIGFFAF